MLQSEGHGGRRVTGVELRDGRSFDCEAVVITVPHSKIDVVRFIEALLQHQRAGMFGVGDESAKQPLKRRA